MKNMSFEEVKDDIKKMFGKREGFTDEVFTAIAASYLYFERNYQEFVDEKDIPDAQEFRLPGDETGKRSLANIYLNRILNNVQSIEYTENESRYAGEDKKVFMVADVSRRLKHWQQKIVDGHEDVLERQIRAKILTHELIHAASDNGIFVGFSVPFGTGDTTKLVLLSGKQPDKYTNLNAQASRLEEAITEILALNIVGCNILDVGFQQSGFLICRNPDSSNHNLNAFAEYFVRVYPDCILGKMTDGWAWNNDFEKTHSIETENPNFMIEKLNDYLRAFSENKLNVVNGVSYYQQFMLLDYLQTLSAENSADLEKIIRDYTAFKLFAARDKANQVDEELQECITKIHDKILSYAEKLNMPKEEIKQIVRAENNKLKSTDGQKHVYTEPYADIINDENEDVLSVG